MVFVILLMLICGVFGEITYDTNHFKGFLYEFRAFSCDFSSQIYTIYFSDSFTKIPQMMLNIEQLDMKLQESGFILKIIEVQLTYFQLKLDCPGNGIYGVGVRWFAFQNGSFQVINRVCDSNIIDLTFFHQLSKVKVGFISLTGITFAIEYLYKQFIILLFYKILQLLSLYHIWYNGPVNFFLTISELTNSSVSVRINDGDGNISNLKQISFQVILTEDLIISSQYEHTFGDYQSLPISNINDAWFIIILQGLQFTNQSILRQNLTYQGHSNNSISYSINGWSETQTQGSYHSQIWFFYKYTLFKCSMIKIQKSLLTRINELPNLQIYFNNLNLPISDPGQYEGQFNKDFYFLQIEVSLKCPLGQTIKFNFQGQQQMQTIKFKCQKNFNYVNANLRFAEDSTNIKLLKLLQTNQSIELIYVYDYQIQKNQTFLKIEQLEL